MDDLGVPLFQETYEWQAKLVVPRTCHEQNWVAPYRVSIFSLFDNI